MRSIERRPVDQFAVPGLEQDEHCIRRLRGSHLAEEKRGGRCRGESLLKEYRPVAVCEYQRCRIHLEHVPKRPRGQKCAVWPDV